MPPLKASGGETQVVTLSRTWDLGGPFLIYKSNYTFQNAFLIYKSRMQTLQELGRAVAARRKSLRMLQSTVAAQAGITPETLSRFEQGRTAEFGARKLLGVLAVLDMELDIVAKGRSGTLDELRKERAL